MIKRLNPQKFYGYCGQADSILIDEARVPLKMRKKTKEVSSNLQRVRMLYPP